METRRAIVTISAEQFRTFINLPDHLLVCNTRFNIETNALEISVYDTSNNDERLPLCVEGAYPPPILLEEIQGPFRIPSTFELGNKLRSLHCYFGGHKLVYAAYENLIRTRKIPGYLHSYLCKRCQGNYRVHLDSPETPEDVL